MRVHQTVLDHLHNYIVPYIFQVHDVDVPYPAELWKGATCESETGSVMFDIEDSRLMAEYFTYDSAKPHLGMSAGNDDDTHWKLVLKDTRVEIPVSWIQESHKARTIYTMVSMPSVDAYECNIRGWLGDSGSELSSAAITITELPNLHMPRGSSPLPEETLHDNLTVVRTETRASVLTLEAAEWEINLMGPVSNPSEAAGPLYTATLRKKDRSPFTLSNEEGIVLAFRQFLSFQAGCWINIPTIVGRPRDLEDWITKRAFVGNLASRIVHHRNQWTATDFRDWPDLFKEFWKRYHRNTRHLNNAIHHYVTCSEIFENDYGIHYATVAARSTLEALVRWWNNLPESHEFHGPADQQFTPQLLKAVEKAELGKDVERHIDGEELQFVIVNASQFRNRIDHGQAGSVDDTEIKRIVAQEQYMHHLARLLILAKLGLRNTDARGDFLFPGFK